MQCTSLYLPSQTNQVSLILERSLFQHTICTLTLLNFSEIPTPSCQKQMCGPLTFLSSIADCNQRIRTTFWQLVTSLILQIKTKVSFSELDTEQHWYPMQLPPGKGGAQSPLTASQDWTVATFLFLSRQGAPFSPFLSPSNDMPVKRP